MRGSEKFAHQVKIELVKLLYQQIRFALWAESFAAISLTAVLWNSHLNHHWIEAWLAFNLICSGLARQLLLLFYRKNTKQHDLTEKEGHFWLILFTIGSLMSGISWGLAGSILMVPHDFIRQAFMIFLLVGVT